MTLHYALLETPVWFAAIEWIATGGLALLATVWVCQRWRTR